MEKITWWTTSGVGNRSTLCSSFLDQGLFCLLWFWSVGIRGTCDYRELNTGSPWCHLKPGYLCRCLLSIFVCEAITATDIPGRNLILVPSQKSYPFTKYLLSKGNHIVFLWPIPIDKVCLVCVTPPLVNLPSVPETEKAIAGQKHALNAVENKSLSLVSMGTVKLFRRRTMVT